MSRLLSLAHLTAIELAPPELIRAAAEAGFDAVGLRLIAVTDTSPGYPLMADPAMRRATCAALRETGLRVHDIEFVKLTPETDPAGLQSFLDAGAELGASEVITAPYDPDLSRLADRLGALSELAAARGLGVSLEFFPWTVVPDLGAALRLVEGAAPDVGILVDSLHFDRSQSRLADLRHIPSRRLRFAHLCDALVAPPYSTQQLLHAGRAERLLPGEGDIDLAGFLSALPQDLPLALEVPMTRRTAELGPEAVIRHVFAATSGFLAAQDSSSS
ncbi:sugar phosphate isomerase/epimerase family protein [Marinovum algicola]|jgi:sugar phosphate isomerase/epimerase|uniref:sugar phosphate isomerase/epimerase family protein n=1 Tax=Marinovum algicola TaxID=42444 RepID=UPI0024BB3403|nr:sugar phosphate isomerase/epimerase [Marinovum algicola]